MVFLSLIITSTGTIYCKRSLQFPQGSYQNSCRCSLDNPHLLLCECARQNEYGSIKEVKSKTDIDPTIKVSINVYTGKVLISSKEQTMVDLVRFYKVSGHLNNIALVIKALAEEYNVLGFKAVVDNEKTTSVLQRLGYILEFLNLSELAEIVEHKLAQRTLKYLLLRPDFHNQTGTKHGRWKLIINDSLELT